MEEREEEYQRVRERIFAHDVSSCFPHLCSAAPLPAARQPQSPPAPVSWQGPRRLGPHSKDGGGSERCFWRRAWCRDVVEKRVSLGWPVREGSPDVGRLRGRQVQSRAPGLGLRRWARGSRRTRMPLLGTTLRRDEGDTCWPHAARSAGAGARGCAQREQRDASPLRFRPTRYVNGFRGDSSKTRSFVQIPADGTRLGVSLSPFYLPVMRCNCTSVRGQSRF